MKKTILCFLSGQTLQGSFFMQMKKTVRFHYGTTQRQLFRTSEESVRPEEIECYFISDIKKDKQSSFLCRIILQGKKKRFIRGFQKPADNRRNKPAPDVGENEYEESISVYKMTDKADYPPEVRNFCAKEFLRHIPLQKNTFIGIIDGEALDYKLWVKLLRERLDAINGLMIISDRPERFTELCRDAWEQQGLIITVTENEKELRFCDIVMDCSRRLPSEKYKFRGSCSYFMLQGYKRKRRLLSKQNRHLQFTECGDFIQKV